MESTTYPTSTEEAAELANVMPPTLEEAYAEGRKDEAEDCAEPLPAATVIHIKRECDALGLDIVAFAWRIQRQAANRQPERGEEDEAGNRLDGSNPNPPECDPRC